jgi:hypothetical protein
MVDKPNTFTADVFLFLSTINRRWIMVKIEQTEIDRILSSVYEQEADAHYKPTLTLRERLMAVFRSKEFYRRCIVPVWVSFYEHGCDDGQAWALLPRPDLGVDLPPQMSREDSRIFEPILLGEHFGALVLCVTLDGLFTFRGFKCDQTRALGLAHHFIALTQGFINAECVNRTEPGERDCYEQE